ncbi:MAG TPA: glycosyltransferase family 9 protein [Chloroflexota bacterium]|nr:glycosyltransferase family 9 protein [Chloroflexota bacterium]
MREELVTAACHVLGAVTGRLASREDTIPPPNPSFVILKRCCLGDVLASTAAVAAIRRRYPLARLDYATEAYSAPALAGNPDLTGIIPPTAGSLRKGRYDVAITLERSPAVAVLPWLARIPIRVGPNSAGRGFAHNLRVACPPDRSEAEIALDCAAALDVPVEGARPKFCPSAADRAAVDDLLPEGQELVAIAPGGGINPGMRLTSKRWPADRFAALAERLSAEHSLRPVLVGGADDAELAGAFGGHAIDLIGRTSLGVTAAILQRCRLFVGNDSAPLHLAAAVGTPFVGIFGPSDPVRHRPLGGGEIVAAPLPRSAYRNGFAAADCIGSVSVGDVLAACERVLRLSAE